MGSDKKRVLLVDDDQDALEQARMAVAREYDVDPRSAPVMPGVEAANRSVSIA